MRILSYVPLLAYVIATSAVSALSAHGQPTLALPQISDETGPVSCPPGFALSKLSCSGRYCDEINATCARYAAPPGSTSQERSYWTDWFSEEGPGQTIDGSNFPRLSNNYSIAVGIQCRGDYCDDIRLQMLPLRGRDVPTLDSKAEAPQCRLSTRFSEETTSPPSPDPPLGKSMEFIRRVGCSGRYCDNLQIEWCKVFHN
jgi:hypothetical protein